MSRFSAGSARTRRATHVQRTSAAAAVVRTPVRDRWLIPAVRKTCDRLDLDVHADDDVHHLGGGGGQPLLALRVIAPSAMGVAHPDAFLEKGPQFLEATHDVLPRRVGTEAQLLALLLVFN